VIAAAAHGLFTGEATALFAADGPDEVIVTDTVPLPRELSQAAAGKVRIIAVSALVADVVGRMHRGEAVSELIPYD